jgi:molybdopterin synthase sulfur carrier subunit
VIRVALPAHLRTLARVNGEVDVEPGPEVTLGAVLDALESQYPVLRGTIRDHHTHKRRGRQLLGAAAGGGRDGRWLILNSP